MTFDKVARDLSRRLARNVARLRAQQGLTLMNLAARADLHLRHLQKIEAGESNATLVTIARLAKGLGVDPSVLTARPPSGK